MAAKNNRYQKMEFLMTCVLGITAFLFVLYLVFAGLCIVWLKIVTAVLTILLAGACLFFLYVTRELLHQRSFWMSVAAAALILCTLVSIIVNFPSPNPYKKEAPKDTSDASACVWIDERI